MVRVSLMIITLVFHLPCLPLPYLLNVKVLIGIIRAFSVITKIRVDLHLKLYMTECDGVGWRDPVTWLPMFGSAELKFYITLVFVFVHTSILLFALADCSADTAARQQRDETGV